MKKFFLWLAVIGIAAMIFSFSHQPIEESFETSDSFIDVVLENVSEGYREMPEEEQKTLLEEIRVFVRKAAHYTEFFLLGAALYALCREYEKKHSFWIALGCGIGYAVTDELHQMFTAGRSPTVKDVGIDSAGVLSGVLLLMWIMKIFGRYRQENMRKDTI